MGRVRRVGRYSRMVGATVAWRLQLLCSYCGVVSARQDWANADVQVRVRDEKRGARLMK